MFRTRPVHPALVLAAALLGRTAMLAQQQQPASSARVIAGRVVSSPDGRPLSNAMVSLQPSQSTNTVASTTSAEDGSFRLPAPPPGKYNLYGQASGHLPACYLQHGEVCTGIVTGAGLDTSALTLSLPSGAGISGHIVENGGDAIEHATVTLYREDLTASPERVVRDRQTQSDDRGYFEFSGLQPATYFLSAGASPWYAVHPPPDPPNAATPFHNAVDPALDVVYATTFFPGALSSDDASPITLHGGEQFAADIPLTPQHSATLTLRLPEGDQGEGRGRHFAVVSSVFGTNQYLPTPVNSTDGRTLEITGVPPGSYRLEEFHNRPGAPVRSIPITAGSASVTLDLPADAPTAAVTLQVHPAPGKTLPRGLRVALRGQDRERLQAEPVDSDGRVTFASVPAGDYRPLVLASGGAPAALSLSVGGRPVSGRTLHHTGREPLQAELTLAGAPIAVQGFVKVAGKPVPGILVVLVPAGADTDPDLFRRDQTDLDGSFALNRVAPGNYILIALSDGWSLRWRDPAVLTPYLHHGVPLTVQPANAPALRIAAPLAPIAAVASAPHP